MPHLLLLRHGQSAWNLENRFTGWVDAALTEAGRAEATRAGELIAATGIAFDAAQTSVLTRAIRTLHLALDAMDRLWLPVTKTWRLNERHYGALTGLDKAETAARHGEAQVRVWRRSYDTPPPPMPADHPFDVAGDPRYADLDPADLPRTESLKTTLERVEPWRAGEIAPRLAAGESLIVAAHGNSLRALVKTLMAVGDDDIPGVEIPTGNPLLVTFEDGAETPVAARYLDEARAATLPPIP